LGKNFRDNELKYAQDNIRSKDRIQRRLAEQVLLTNFDDDLRYLESMRKGYETLLQERIPKLKSEGMHGIASMLEDIAVLLGAYSLEPDGPLASRIFNERTSRASKAKRSKFNTDNQEVAEEVVKEFPTGTSKHKVLSEFMVRSGVTENDREYASDLVNEAATRYMKKFKTGHPGINDDPHFESVVLNHVIQQPKDGWKKILDHVKEMRPRPYQGRLSDTEIESKVKSVFNKYQLQSREKREEFSLKKSSFS
jgi:hypothetical protein